MFPNTDMNPAAQNLQQAPAGVPGQPDNEEARSSGPSPVSHHVLAVDDILVVRHKLLRLFLNFLTQLHTEGRALSYNFRKAFDV